MNTPITRKMPNPPEEPRFPLALRFGALLGALLFFALTALLIAGVDTKRAQVAGAALVDSSADIALKAKSAVVVDLTSGEVFYEKNADVQLPLASLTKVALALAVSEVLPRDSVLTIPQNSASDVALRLGTGRKWRVDELLDFTLITSSNGGAEMLAEAANDELHRLYPNSPTEGATVWRMNELARELDLEHTFFLNPSGLDESETQSGAYGSARDMAKLFAYALERIPSVFSRTARAGVLLFSENGAQAHLENTNVAQRAISGLIMGKTGFTDLAGGNLGVIFDASIGRPIVAVVLGSTYDGRFDDIRTLVSRARTSVAKGG